MTNPTTTAEGLQTEVINYMQYAANEVDALLRCLTAERDALDARVSSISGVAPVLLTFTLSSSGEAATGHRRIELNAERATGFVEANGESIGLVHTEIKHKKTDGTLFQASDRRTEAVAEKAIEEKCHSIVRALLLA